MANGFVDVDGLITDRLGLPPRRLMRGAQHCMSQRQLPACWYMAHGAWIRYCPWTATLARLGPSNVDRAASGGASPRQSQLPAAADGDLHGTPHPAPPWLPLPLPNLPPPAQQPDNYSYTQGQGLTVDGVCMLRVCQAHIHRACMFHSIWLGKRTFVMRTTVWRRATPCGGPAAC